MTTGVGEQPARLSIGYGRAYTRAVLAWPDHRYLPLAFDGGPALSCAVHAAPDGTITTGTAAWQAARAAPQGFEPAPVQRITQGEVTLADQKITVVELIAATLRRVGEQATRVAGTLPT